MKHFVMTALRLAASCVAMVGTAFLSQAVWAAACVPGHGTVIPPCTFDGGVLTLQSATNADFSSGGGHNTQITFPVSPTLGPGIQIAADPSAAFPTFSASHDGINGVDTATIGLTVSAQAGFLIHDVSFTLLSPQVTGTGTISWSLDGVTETFPGSSFVDIVLPQNVSSITDTLIITLSEGSSGDASIVGGVINYSLVPAPVPEPASLAIFGTALLGFGVLRRRRKPRDASVRMMHFANATETLECSPIAR